VDVFAALQQNHDPVMAVENGPVTACLQGISLSQQWRRLQYSVDIRRSSSREIAALSVFGTELWSREIDSLTRR
jgi:hypothetical protein